MLEKALDESSLKSVDQSSQVALIQQNIGFATGPVLRPTTVSDVITRVKLDVAHKDSLTSIVLLSQL